MVGLGGLAIPLLAGRISAACLSSGRGEAAGILCIDSTEVMNGSRMSGVEGLATSHAQVHCSEQADHAQVLVSLHLSEVKADR